MSLAIELAGVRAPNPFWLASGPPTRRGDLVARAFEAGWGGAVWRTLGGESAAAPSFAAAAGGLCGSAPAGDLRELADVAAVKRRFPDRALVVSLAGPIDRELIARVVDSGADAIEVADPAALPAGCELPVLAKLGPGGDARAAARAGAAALVLIGAVDGLAGVDLDTFAPHAPVAGPCGGPALRPLALRACADAAPVGLPIAGSGGIATWRDAAEMILVGASVVQLCTAVMQRGFRIIDELVDGLANYLRDQGLASPAALRGRALHAPPPPARLALIDQDRCIGCGLCRVACDDAGFQAIAARAEHGRTRAEVRPDACPGCGLCGAVCPVPGCISMAPRPPEWCMSTPIY